jgi:SAM-dependent methyltransferase
MAHAAVERGEPLAWFEQLYAEVNQDPRRIPWADLAPNPNLVEWMDRERVTGGQQRALVVGCGLGDDAEELARRGFQVSAFDISKTVVAWARERFSKTRVDYQQADLLQLPASWRGRFDCVFEAYTLQVLPPAPRRQAIACIAACLKSQGTLLVITRGREQTDDRGPMPWPLTRIELNGFTAAGLHEVRFEDYVESEDPPVRRFRVEYRRLS